MSLDILDVAIGLVFVYLVLSLAVTAANELFAAAFKRRARMLRAGINHLLDGKQQTRVLGSAGELRQALQEVFGIDTSALAELDRRFESLQTPADAAA